MVGKGFREEATFELAHKRGAFHAEEKVWHVPVIKYASWVQTHPSFIGDGLFKNFSFLSFRMLSFISSGCWGDTARGKGFGFLIPGCLFNRCSCGFSSFQLLSMGSSSSTQILQWTAASRTQKPAAAPWNPLGSFHSEVPLMRHLAMNSFPGKFQRMNFQQIPPLIYLPSVSHGHALPSGV